MDLSRIRINDLVGPPCRKGDDLGLGVAQPIYIPNSSVTVKPRGLLAVAVRIPADSNIVTKDEHGNQLSYLKLPEGAYHVMLARWGNGQFALAPHLLDPNDPLTTHGAFITDNTASLKGDRRVRRLRNFWRGKGYGLKPFAVRATGPVNVLGRINMAKLGNRWFDGENIHRCRGGAVVIDTGCGLRLLTGDEAEEEFDYEAPLGTILANH